MANFTTTTDLLAALEIERIGFEAVLPRYSEEQWRAVTRSDGWNAHDIAAHLADANYGLALLVLGEIKPNMPLNADGWMDIDEYNQQRREKNASLTKAKVESRLASSFEHARRAIEATDDLAADGPYGPVHTKAMWLNRIVAHSQAHRQELEELLG
jgi:hypothetical protein